MFNSNFFQLHLNKNNNKKNLRGIKYMQGPVITFEFCFVTFHCVGI